MALGTLPLRTISESLSARRACARIPMIAMLSAILPAGLFAVSATEG